MSITYTEQYETKKAYVEMSLTDGKYIIDYIVTSPIDGKVTNVNAYIGKVEEETTTRIGYATFDKGVVSVRFDGTEYTTSVSNQSLISAQFYNDLQAILA